MFFGFGKGSFFGGEKRAKLGFLGSGPKSGVVKKIGPTRVCLRFFGALFKNRNIS